ncbi:MULTISPECIES: hypothetical protein [unclassified Chamaesiphon]|uniref:hypothetical protein n=1 Tax=unclassified Chamaesiphon TaxID=2620921 RepID=UPI00286A3798|nr:MULTISPECIES: hypothetical protein [unclassified Chamaesiphon]
MSKVLIAAGIGWSFIAISAVSCSSKSPTAKIDLAPMAVAEQTAPGQNLDRLPIVIPSTAPIGSPDVKTVTVSSPAPVPDVNSLNSIADLARKPATELANLQLKSDAAPQDPIADDLQPTHSEDVGNIAARSPKNAICKSFPCLVLSKAPSHPYSKFQNPIYQLTAYRNKTSSSTFQLDAVSGRGFTQARNRYQSQTEAPLPDGSYSISARVVAGTIAEVGGTMVPIFPKPGFDRRMRRTALGIHWDPSFNKDKKEDGTSGCIGLTTKKNYQRVRDFILTYRPRSLEVRIDRGPSSQFPQILSLD